MAGAKHTWGPAAAAIAVALLVAALAGCGDDASKTFGTMTDCAKVGKPSALKDPAGDQAGRLEGADAQTQGDLLAVRIARGGGRLCGEFRVASTVKPAAAYLLALRPLDADTPVAQLEVTVLGAVKPAALLNTGAKGATFRKVDATIGLKGDRLTVLVDRRQFERFGLEGLFDGFRFQARTAVVVGTDGRQTDCAPTCR